MFDIHWWLNLASFIGIAVLSVPVWSLNFRRKRLQQIRDAEKATSSDTDFRARARKLLMDRHKRNVEDWRPIDQLCLGIGYFALLGSAFLRLFFPAA
ncbi:hypothetical protein [Salipiger sp.]|uniref:hypothetical protein n=1 Tax=Salipiger sp. TaxID=2078585 RepID=UPI003A96CFD2